MVDISFMVNKIISTLLSFCLSFPLNKNMLYILLYTLETIQLFFLFICRSIQSRYICQRAMVCMDANCHSYCSTDLNFKDYAKLSCGNTKDMQIAFVFMNYNTNQVIYDSISIPNPKRFLSDKFLLRTKAPIIFPAT